MTARADMLRSFFECYHWLYAQVTAVADVLKSCGAFYRWFSARVTKNMHGINNKSNGVVRMYVTTFVTHKPLVRIDLLTRFMKIVKNFALEPYSKLCSFHNLFVNRNVCQISIRFKEANCAWNNWFSEVQLWRFRRNCCRWTGFIWRISPMKVLL